MDSLILGSSPSITVGFSQNARICLPSSTTDALAFAAGLLLSKLGAEAWLARALSSMAQYGSLVLAAKAKLPLNAPSILTLLLSR